MFDRTLLEISDLRVHFHLREGIAKAVDGVDLTVNQGETIGIVGESGCGKTVTALSILRLIPEPPARIAGGKIQFQNTNLIASTEEQLRKIRGNDISMIFQEPMTSLNPVFRVGHQIAQAIRIHQGLSKRDAYHKTIEMLRLVGIPSPELRTRDYPHQLSGGMRQRVMIAMAISCRPRLLIADEPTTALDVTIQAQILDLMNRLKEEMDTLIILITHDQGVIAENAQSVVVMYAGKVVESAGVKVLFGQPLHPYTIGLMNAVPRTCEPDEAGRRLYVIPGTVPALFDLPPGCKFAARCPKATQRCVIDEPALKPIDDDHLVRCWNIDS